ncbi:3-methyladenine DNA glycosylase [Yamadazyma tenuis]|uniref:3-methyladenine DNA glycosylase n=1 Tax=Candida tenuis TaxID=2315449 RepID=UPI0027A32644|nr:3-methyladenine DNA glycosylase [Yamadazyma tenuis]
MAVTRQEVVTVVKTAKKVVKPKAKKAAKSKRTLFEESLDHIDILPEHALPATFVEYHTPQFIQGVKHVLSVDPSLYRPIVSQNFERYKKNVTEEKREAEIIKSYWLSLISSVISQQISGSAAAAIYSRFETLFEKEPNPAELLTKSHEQLREIGLSNQKVKYVTHISQVFGDPDDNLTSLSFYKSNPESVVVQELTKLKGIGEWSARMFTCFTLNSLDVFAHDDLGVARGASYYFSKRPEVLKRVKAEVNANEDMKLLLKKKGS